jgi:hypothetical protein
LEDDDKVQSHEVEVKQNEIPIDPTLYDHKKMIILKE